MSDLEKSVRPTRGRKPAYESRATELRRRLIVWKQSPEELRPSLRALAEELGTSHQLLKYYLDRLESWRAREEGKRIRARAKAEGREMTLRECLNVMVTPGMLDRMESLRRDARRRPLNWYEAQMLKIFAKWGFPGAKELFEKCSRNSLKKKCFTEIVRETPRQEGETYMAWVQRIWDQCAVYGTSGPAVITEELLQKLSQRGADNLHCKATVQ